ncbi:MAG: hypothetical protein AAB434_06405 [Planctomycetota bacterium]
MRILLALAVACAVVQADTVFMKDGSKVEGKVVGNANGKVGVKTTEGKMVWLDEATIDHVEKSAVEAPPDAAPPTDPAAGPPKVAPKGPLKGPKCPACKGKRTVKCTTCVDGLADIMCLECGGQGFLNCPACKGRAVRPCACEGKNPKCPKCGGTGAGEDCDSCASGSMNCPGCNGARIVQGPCPDCKRKKKVPCPTCQGTGVDPSAAPVEGAPDEAAPPPDPATEPPPEETAEAPPEEPAVEEPPKEIEKPKLPTVALSSASVEILFGVVEGLKRTDGLKLWKVSVKLTNGEDLGSLVVKCTDFTLRTDDGTEVKALVPERSHFDSAPKMVGKAATKDLRLYFETARDRVPKTLLFTTPKWQGEPFTLDLPKHK